MKLKILQLFPDLLNQYFDSGNVLCMKQRLMWRGIECELQAVRRDDPLTSLGNTDIVFIGGGADKEQLYVCKSLLKYKNELKSYIEDGGTMLAICGGYQLLGNYYKLRNETIQGLEILDIYTTVGERRLIGDVILEADFLPADSRMVVGFENHGGRTHIGTHTPFGRTLYGNGNSDMCGCDGVMYKNLIGTYLHGPLLPKNPALCDFILNRAIGRRYADFDGLSPLDDSMERTANEYLVKKYLKK